MNRVSLIWEMESRMVDGLYATKAYFDFGTVNKSQMRQVLFSFPLENKGEKDIHIDGVDVSCGCLVIDKFPEKILSGKEDTLRGHILTENLRGKVSKPIFVNFDNHQVMLLRVLGTVN